MTTSITLLGKKGAHQHQWDEAHLLKMPALYNPKAIKKGTLLIAEEDLELKKLTAKVSKARALKAKANSEEAAKKKQRTE